MTDLYNLPVVRPYYKLLVHLDSQDEELRNMYETKFATQREKTMRFITGENICVDAGVDIFTPTGDNVMYRSTASKLTTSLRCAMYYIDADNKIFPSGYYMYPRSSTGSSTPLRLANSVGIIDAGYRGELMGYFNNVNSNYDYTVEKYQRLLQIVSANMTYPIYPEFVNEIKDLDCYISHNDRVEGGFGSTGK
jgi:dUTP pyrophosphatase